jgi:tetratricopeptide (TPR) repeat protein
MSENLFIKIVKIEEKRQNFTVIREMINEAKAVEKPGNDSNWRILLEGALFEGRCGNRNNARDIFSHLMTKCKSFGPVFLEAAKYEEREGQLLHSIDICERGLDYNPSFNPLWFQYLRLYEKVDDDTRAKKFDSFDYIITDMLRHISKEFHWKIHMELAHCYSRLKNFERSKEHLNKAVLDCPDSIKWKLLIVYSRILINEGDLECARKCIERACFDVPPKQVSVALLEYAKYFEICGETGRALEIMDKVKIKFKNEWKIQFEVVMMLIRLGLFDRAERELEESLNIHSSTGRLWAIYIELLHKKARTPEDFEYAHSVFKKALIEIPKSGEVWCEGARIAMTQNPNN